ncbi:MAG TPA: hypothetical protein VFP40_05735 [Terriglobales bacterium]|nr:hypothetical protein [Terriglobales bacterium]
MRICALLLLFVSVLPSSTQADDLARRKWFEVRTANFVVFSDASEKSAREAAMKLEQFRAVIGKAMNNLRQNTAEPTVVFAARDENTMKALLPAMWEGHRARPAGAFMRGWEQSHAVLRLDFGEPSYEIIRHEYFHNLESLNFVSLPVWLNEGMAEFFATSEITDKEAKLGMPSPRLRTVRGVAPIPLKTLLTVDARSPYYRDEDKVYRFYAQSWALTHMLIVGPGMENGRKMDEYIVNLHHEPDAVKAFEQTFGDMRSMDTKFTQYVDKFAFPILVMRDPPKPDEKDVVSRQLSPEEITAQLAEFYRATHRKKEAEQFLAQAEQQKSTVPVVHRTKAFMAFQDGKDQEALAEFDKAIAGDPKDYLSLYYATMLKAEANPGQATDEIIAGMRKVRDINPNFAPAHVELSRAYMKAGRLDLADGAAMTAAKAEQGRAGYWSQWARVRLARGDAKGAAEISRYVAERWTGTDRDQAIEIWKEAVAKDSKLGEKPLAVSSDAPEGSVASGTIAEVKCEEKKPLDMSLKTGDRVLHLTTEEGKSFRMGFEDTVWFGSDHFSLCHHVQGRQANVIYKPMGEDKGLIEQIRVEDSFPEPVAEAKGK